jgi:hypothetical protein
MKRTLVTLALVAAAGTAAAQTATTPSVGGATVTPPSVGAGTVTTPPANPPAATMPAVPSRSISAPSTANAPPLPNAQGSNSAIKKIERDGYKNVQGLTRGADGKWHGKALRGSAMVDVEVDAAGRVSAQ